MNVRGRIRQLKPELFLDDEFWALQRSRADLPVLQGFLGLWCQADREGRFEWRPAVLKTQILPYWDGDFAAVMELLREAGILQSYEVGGRRYGSIRSFHKHQRPNNREPLSCIPDPLERAEAVPLSAHESAQAPRASRPPLPTTNTQHPTPRRDAPPESAPEHTQIRTLPPSKREQAREAEAARLGATPAIPLRFDPKWDPNDEHRARGHELGLTDDQILEEADDCRNKIYPHGFATEDAQFFRELKWLATDLEKKRFQEMNRHGRDKFENPGRDRAAR